MIRESWPHVCKRKVFLVYCKSFNRYWHFIADILILRTRILLLYLYHVSRTNGYNVVFVKYDKSMITVNVCFPLQVARSERVFFQP